MLSRCLCSILCYTICCRWVCLIGLCVLGNSQNLSLSLHITCSWWIGYLSLFHKIMSVSSHIFILRHLALEMRSEGYGTVYLFVRLGVWVHSVLLCSSSYGLKHLKEGRHQVFPRTSFFFCVSLRLFFIDAVHTEMGVWWQCHQLQEQIPHPVPQCFSHFVLSWAP